jgi:hypothetical protein
MRKLAEPAPVGAHIETLIRNVARKLGWSFSRAYSIWYRNARLIRAEEMDALRRASQAKAGTEVAELQVEYSRLITRLKVLEEALAWARADQTCERRI